MASYIYERMAKRFWVLCVVVLALIGLVWWTSATGRSDVVTSQRDDCFQRAISAKSGSVSWAFEARAWKKAGEVLARRGDDRDLADLAALAKAASANGRSYADRLARRGNPERCKKAFRDPGPFAFR